MNETATALRSSVVVPTFNEAANLPRLLRRIHAAAPEAEIIVVDDGSPDGTAAVAKGLAAELPVRVVERSERGLASAVIRGMQEARTDICLVLDADFSHPPEAIPSLLRAVEDGADVAIGSRYVNGGAIDDWPLLRRMTSRAGSFLARPLTSVRDPLAGFFALRRTLIEDVSLRPRGFKILLEILVRARPRRVVEVPIRFEDRGEGASKFDWHQRREYLRQVAALYRATNAWPLRVAKFLATGGLGWVVHMAVLCAIVESGALAPLPAAVAAFAVAMSGNYAVNRAWTFRAHAAPFLTSYVLYAAGALVGLAAQLAVMRALSRVHYALTATLGIAVGTILTFSCVQFLAFRKRT